MLSPINPDQERTDREQLAQVATAVKEMAGQVRSIKILVIVYVVATISISVGTTALTMSGFFMDQIREQLDATRSSDRSSPSTSASSSAGGASVSGDDDLLSAGDSIPAIKLQDADGRVWTNSDWDGKLVLLNFWATWCAPCRREMPYFEEAQKKYAESGFTVIAISVDRKGWEVVRPYLAELQPTFPVLLADESTRKSFGTIRSLPTTFFVHRNGRVHARHVGSLSRTHLQNHIESLLSKDPLRKTPPTST